MDIIKGRRIDLRPFRLIAFLTYNAQDSQQCCGKYIEEVDHACCEDQDEPDALDAEFSVLSKFVMKRGRNVLEKNDLLLGKSSNRDLNDGDTAVTKERKSYDEVKERNPAVDQEECDEETEAS